jgi:hypothetical protein
MSFAQLRKNRKSSIEKLQKAAEETVAKKSYDDDRFWKPTRDKAGNGFAVIRFLPQKDVEATPWVEYFDHAFKGPTGQWYIEKSLTTINPKTKQQIGDSDPVGEYNSKLWNSVDSDNTPERRQAREQKRRRNFVANIYVEDDPANPENVGKVFLYKFGKKIFDKLMDAMQPQFQDEDPINPFDLWEGASFKLKIRANEHGWPNYDKSEFSKVKPLKDDDDELEEIFNKVYALDEFTDPKTFKSYDELKAKLYRVLGEEKDNMSSRKDQEQLGEEEEAPRMKEEDTSFESNDIDDDDDSMAFFQSLAKDD